MNLSVKNVPDRIVKRLRRRAQINHRSLQGELLTILEQAVGPAQPLTIAEARRRIAKLHLHMPDEATRMIREDRDAR